MWRSAAKDNLRPQRKGYFGAQSHTPRNRCVRFVFGIAAASRNTRFQAACWALPGPDLHRPIAPAWLPPSLCAPYRFCGQYTAGSPLSVGLASTFLKDSLMGTLRLMPLGGIGLRDHVSEIPFTAPPR